MADQTQKAVSFLLMYVLYDSAYKKIVKMKDILLQNAEATWFHKYGYT